MPEARTLLEATVEAGNLARAAAARCINVFNSQHFKLKSNLKLFLQRAASRGVGGGSRGRETVPQPGNFGGRQI